MQLKLYEILDEERSAYVIAESWEMAQELWSARVHEECGTKSDKKSSE